MTAQVKFFRFFYLLVIIGRILFGILILPAPLLGWVLSFWFDQFDYGVSLRAHVSYKYYQYIDKTLDVWFRIGMVGAAIYLGWPMAWLFVILMVIRTIGDLLYLFYKHDVVLMVFPNIMEFYFPLYLFYLNYTAQNGENTNLSVALFIIATILKLINEYMLHYKKFMTDPLSYRLLKLHPELGRPESAK